MDLLIADKYQEDGPSLFSVDTAAVQWKSGDRTHPAIPQPSSVHLLASERSESKQRVLSTTIVSFHPSLDDFYSPPAMEMEAKFGRASWESCRSQLLPRGKSMSLRPTHMLHLKALPAQKIHEPTPTFLAILNESYPIPTCLARARCDPHVSKYLQSFCATVDSDLDAALRKSSAQPHMCHTRRS